MTRHYCLGDIMRRFVIILPVALLGCANIPLLDRLPGRGGDVAEVPTVDVAAPEPLPVPAEPTVPTPVVNSPLAGPAASPASLDTVSEADKEAARAAAETSAAGGELGTVTVALGSPTEPGLWVKSALVTEDTPGTVRTGSGETIAVTLRPLGGEGGPQISLSALQALSLPLAGLHPVTLSRAG